MRRLLLPLSVLALLGAGLFVGYTALRRPRDAYMARELAGSFDLAVTPASEPPVAASRSQGPAAASVPSSLTRPLGGQALALSAGRARAARPASGARAEAWARGHSLWSALTAAPARFLLERSALRSPVELREFLRRPAEVDAYLDSPLMRVVLNSPAAAKALLGDPALVAAAVSMPAMKDEAALRELGASPMLRKMLDCPGVVGALGDPAVRDRLFSDPAVASWLAAHPEAFSALGVEPATGRQR